MMMAMKLFGLAQFKPKQYNQENAKINSNFNYYKITYKLI